MNPETLEMLRAAEEAVRRLVEQCRKNGPLYRVAPKEVAHISRTGKWHLNAIAALRRAVASSGAASEQPAS
jgi:hypothetical protein